MIDLNKTNLRMELLINITNSLDGKCSVPENEEIKTGDDVKFSAAVSTTVSKEDKLKTHYKFTRLK